MNKTELEKKIAEMQEQFDKMQKQLDELKQVKIEEPKKRWKPEIDEKYFFISYEGTVCVSTWSNDYVDNWRYFIGIVFQTPQEAKEYRKKIEIQAQFRNFVEERSEEFDWENDDQCKYYLYYNYCLKRIMIGYIWTCKFSFQVFASSEQILKDAIAEIGEENIKKYVLEVEDEN